jgi:hypothetical protein
LIRANRIPERITYNTICKRILPLSFTLPEITYEIINEVGIHIMIRAIRMLRRFFQFFIFPPCWNRKEYAPFNSWPCLNYSAR